MHLVMRASVRRASISNLLAGTAVGLLALGGLAGAVLVGPTRANAATGADLCAQVGYNAGFRNSSLVTAVAVALAESGCNPSATNTNSNGSVDRGLWQINSVHIPPYTVSCLFDAQCNAGAAWDISSHGTNWQPWTTYNDGAYRNFLSTAQAAVDRLGNVIDRGGEFADLNGDGKGDLIVAESDGTLWDYPGSGSLTSPFSSATRHQIGTGFDVFDRLLAGDLNGDGKADLIATKSDGTLWDYPGSGSLTSPFTSATRHQIGTGFDVFDRILIGDLNGDGKADLVASKSDGTLWDYPGSGSLTSPFTSATRHQIGTGFDGLDSISLGDINADNKADLIATKSDGTLLDYPGSGSLTSPFSSATSHQIGTGFDTYQRIRVGDLNNDNKADLIGVTSNGTMTDYPGSGSLTSPYTSATENQIGTGFDIFSQLT